MMKSFFTFLGVFMICTSFAYPPAKYYIGQSPKIIILSESVQYILAERRGDSLQIWYGVKGKEMTTLNMRYKTETILCKPGNGIHFTIKKVLRNVIVGYEMRLKRITNFRKYCIKRNEIIADIIEDDYNDTIIKIKQLTFSRTYSSKMGNHDTMRYLIANTHCDSFETRYKNYIYANLSLVYIDIREKKKLYEDLKNKTVIADSLLFKTFPLNYERGEIDHKILHYILVHYPALFYLRKMNVDGIFGNEITYCDECFTKIEIAEMYNSLKPFREKCPAIFWMFDQKGQHQGYIDY